MIGKIYHRLSKDGAQAIARIWFDGLTVTTLEGFVKRDFNNDTPPFYRMSRRS
jgi:hypothetical protein